MTAQFGKMKLRPYQKKISAVIFAYYVVFAVIWFDEEDFQGPDGNRQLRNKMPISTEKWLSIDDEHSLPHVKAAKEATQRWLSNEGIQSKNPTEAWHNIANESPRSLNKKSNKWFSFDVVTNFISDWSDREEANPHLSDEDRILEITKETWPECVEQGMTAVECKEFIDFEILSHFTDTDQWIRTFIIGKRDKDDKWYNAIVIPMADDDLSVGRDGNGLIYYDFEWDGCGKEATIEQQTAIPPIIAEENTNYLGGSGGTGDTPGPGDDDPTTDDGAPVGDVPATTDDVTEGDAPVGDAPATYEPVGDAPATTEPGDSEPQVVEPATDDATISAVVDNSVSSGNIDDYFFRDDDASTINGWDPLNSPVILKEEEEIVTGEPTDQAIDEVLATGTTTDLIAGGVLIDPSAQNTPEGDTVLTTCLHEPATLVTAGIRTLGPFDCTGLTGTSCCLLIKHKVRDADNNGKAIQCFLDYAEGTKKKNVMKNAVPRPGKKVFIHANHNHKVSKVPFIRGNWGGHDPQELWAEYH